MVLERHKKLIQFHENLQIEYVYVHKSKSF